MTPRAVLRRRGLITAAIGGGVTWLGGRMLFLVAGGGRVRSMSGSGTLVALCSDLSYPRTIGKACLETLPPIEASKAALTRVILADIRATGRDGSSASALAHIIRDQSRDDFRDGRIVTVDGWMLSLTETRIYALAALLSQPRETVE
jgi:hypothetical protein